MGVRRWQWWQRAAFDPLPNPPPARGREQITIVRNGPKADMTMDINLPDVLAEMQAVFARYEDALVNNQVDVLDELFWPSALTVRYGVGENLLGIEAIRAFRVARPATGLARTLSNTVITTYGRDFATAMTEYRRDGQMKQAWLVPVAERLADAHEVGALDEEFHAALVRAVGNSEIARVHRDVTDRIRIGVRRRDDRGLQRRCAKPTTAATTACWSKTRPTATSRPSRPRRSR